MIKHELLDKNNAVIGTALDGETVEVDASILEFRVRTTETNEAGQIIFQETSPLRGMREVRDLPNGVEIIVEV